jgi:hypothetical protein
MNIIAEGASSTAADRSHYVCDHHERYRYTGVTATRAIAIPTGTERNLLFSQAVWG